MVAILGSQPIQSSPQQSERRNPCPRMQSVTERDFASANNAEMHGLSTPLAIALSVSDGVLRFRFAVALTVKERFWLKDTREAINRSAGKARQFPGKLRFLLKLAQVTGDSS